MKTLESGDFMNKAIKELFNKSIEMNHIDNALYSQYDVKKGLRNEDNTGVLVGLTKISDVVGYERINEEKKDTEGKLYYRGIEIKDFVKGIDFSKHTAFEETAFLILFGYLPTQDELDAFMLDLRANYSLPKDFIETHLLKMPNKNLMNRVQQAILMLYDYDLNPDDTSLENTMAQGLNIIAKLPAIIAYSYQSKLHYLDHKSLMIHQVKEDYSISESILRLIRKDKSFTDTEARVLDCMLLLHIDHGGGNNSTFTNVVIASTGTDFYSTLVGSVGSLKGPRHGGANLAVCEMMSEVIHQLGYDASIQEMENIIDSILDKEFYDHSGLIYGIGHAVYTLSDPRSEILKEKANELAIEKNMVKEFNFYKQFEEVAIQRVFLRKGKRVASNVDFYSGFVYSMLNIPEELVSLLFVCARTVGWLAHNIEDKCFSNKIVRPATKYVGEMKAFIPMEERK